MNSRTAHQIRPALPLLARPRSALDSFLLRMATQASVPHLKHPVGVLPASDYFNRKGMQRLGWRAVRRELMYRLSGQAGLQSATIQPHWKRALFLYFDANQIGDALMDLAPRSLLREAGLKVDLLTSPAVAGLFEGDPWFERVSSQAQVLAQAADRYDFIITLSNKRRSLSPKRKHFAGLPWVSVHERFCGPDFDRAGFATQRLSDLLGLQLSRNAFDFHARQKLAPLATRERAAMDAPAPVALCLGGVDPKRTYEHWSAVVAQLAQQGVRDFVLLGSHNGLAAATALMQQFAGQENLRMANHVGSASISQTRAILQNAAVLACSDGGLMHVAMADNVPTLALFSGTIRPEWRLRPQGNPVSTLSSATADINALPPRQVAASILALRGQLLGGAAA
jgi:heptosyltransferase-2